MRHLIVRLCVMTVFLLSWSHIMWSRIILNWQPKFSLCFSQSYYSYYTFKVQVFLSVCHQSVYICVYAILHGCSCCHCRLTARRFWPRLGPLCGRGKDPFCVEFACYPCVCVWLCSHFLPQYKDIQVNRIIDDSKGVNKWRCASPVTNWWLFAQCQLGSGAAPHDPAKHEQL